MIFTEEALTFECAGECLVGVVSLPASPAVAAVIVIVGGPQYRVGSHRQFVLLARHLAASGVAVMRFDYRSMGDSTGKTRNFEDCEDDIGAAITALRSRCPTVSRIVLWGLCDGASAALLYLSKHADPAVSGLCLLNPWVRSDASHARTQVKHYYAKRLFEAVFWRKVFSGGVDVAAATRELLIKVRAALRNPASGPLDSAPSYQTRMADALRRFPGQVLLVLSGRDYTAKEFLDYAGTDRSWSGLLAGANVRRWDVPYADHTFSSAEARSALERRTLDWLVEARIAAD